MRIKRDDLPEGWSIESADFINKCLQRKADKRLGQGGTEEVKQHYWLRDVDWQALSEKRIEAPYKPRVGSDNFDEVRV